MRRHPNKNILKYLTILALSVAIIGIGFGHRAPNIQNDAAIEAYLLNGGSIWDICGDPSDTGEHASSSCEACRLVEAIHLVTQTCLPTRQNLNAARRARLHLPFQRQISSVSTLNPARAPPIQL